MKLDDRSVQQAMAITAERARELIEYRPATGEFFWLRSRGGRRAGTPAGHTQLFPKNRRRGADKKYLVIRVEGRLYLAHRLAWLITTGNFPSELVDHVDGDSLNNIFANFREATHPENMRNSKRRQDNKSGFKGVSWDRINSKWVARIRVHHGKYRNLGRFERAADAHAAYLLAANDLYGEFARAA